MISRGDLRARVARLIRLPPSFLAPVCVLLVVLAANAVYLLQLRSNNPILYFSGLGSPEPGEVSGSITIDGNYGWTAQALGRLSAQTWLDGHVPLWNHFEGLGQPLAGEMQSAAFFLPFVLLQALPNGIFLMQLSLELVAGFGTLAFLRSLRLSWAAATCGACLFALNGAFSVMTNAPFNPIAFLPVALWGVELARRSVQAGQRPRLGLWVIALAIALMIFAGFPETAFLEGVFVAIWALVRLDGLRGNRLRFLGLLAAGAVFGLLISAPALAAFAHFLGFGNVSSHAGAANELSYPLPKLTSLALPYGVGPMANSVFVGQAGYLTLPAVLVGLVGFLGKRRPAVLVALGLLVVTLVLNMFGFPPVKAVLNELPGIRNTFVGKYGLALLEFAVVIFAAYGIDDIRRSRVRRPAVLVAALLVAGYLVGAMAWAAHRGLLVNGRWTTAVVTWTVVACVAVGLLLMLRRPTGRRAAFAAAGAAAVLIVDGAGTYAVPQASASARSTVNMAPVRYLQEHAGTYRFFTLGPISPNYGSYWQIPQLNVNDLPVPNKFSKVITETLKPKAGTELAEATWHDFMSGLLIPYAGVSRQDELLAAYGQKQQYYRDMGAKYIVMNKGAAPDAEIRGYGLQLVFQDASVQIWQDPKAKPMYATTGDACTVTAQSMTEVELDCAESSTLVRRQLSSPGWTATINGAEHAVADRAGQLYQHVRVPAGKSTVVFSYLPTYFVPAAAVSLAVVGLMLVDGSVFLVLRRRRRTARPTPEIA
ncbi:hypothetical protein [Flexivirga meconopsidis]|uniref:hypothetical protein n=1 Tax=Flexivirga meconopsidis TaxID=2977121 RepID=UPI002240AD66|nr:hypothetical protein [Flexivirga meconopsidis]